MYLVNCLKRAHFPLRLQKSSLTALPETWDLNFISLITWIQGDFHDFQLVIIEFGMYIHVIYISIFSK